MLNGSCSAIAAAGIPFVLSLNFGIKQSFGVRYSFR
jgi:hypothetical protein